MRFGRHTMAIRQINSPTTEAVLIPKPSFGYSVELRRGVKIQKFAQHVGTFDRGKEFDRRRCVFRITATGDQVRSLRSVLDRERRNEHNRFILTLESNSGFFPAGADKGDSGEFVFSFTENIKFSALKLSHYGLFDVDFNILIHEAPHIMVLLAKKDLGGKFRFGDVAEIRDPQISPRQDFGARRQITIGGEALTTWTPTDEFTSELVIRTTTGKVAELAQFFGNNRGESFRVVTGENYYLWGAQDKGRHDESVKLLNSNFIMTHTGYDLWSVPVQIWREYE